MKKVILYFKELWKALIGKSHFISDMEAYGCKTSRPVDMSAPQNGMTFKKGTVDSNYSALKEISQGFTSLP